MIFFSFDEMGNYDLPAMINKALQVTIKSWKKIFPDLAQLSSDTQRPFDLPPPTTPAPKQESFFNRQNFSFVNY